MLVKTLYKTVFATLFLATFIGAKNVIVVLLFLNLYIAIPNVWASETNWFNSNSVSFAVEYSHQDKYYIRINYSLSVAPIENGRLLWQLTDAELLDIEFEDGDGDSSIPDEWKPFFLVLPDMITDYDGSTLERLDYDQILNHMIKKYELDHKAADELKAASVSSDFTYFFNARMNRLIGAALLPIHKENPNVGEQKQIQRKYQVKNITTNALESISVTQNSDDSQTVHRILEFSDENFNQYLSAELNYDLKNVELEESNRTFKLEVGYKQGDKFPVNAIRRNTVKYKLPDQMVSNVVTETYRFSR